MSCPDLRQHRACTGRSELCSRDATSSPRFGSSHRKSALRGGFEWIKVLSDLLFTETGMLLPGKYSEGKKKQKEKYEVRANLKDFVPEEENTDK